MPDKPQTTTEPFPWKLWILVLAMPSTTDFWVPLVVGPYAGGPHCPEWILSALR
jgi:hypothetical protein